MTVFCRFVGCASAFLIACQASGPARLRVSKEPFQNTGLHLVERPGRGELLVAPDLDRVRDQIRATDGAILHCRVAVVRKLDSPDLGAARDALERELCAGVGRYITSRPRPQVGPGSEAPSRIVSEPGPGIMFVEAWLVDVEGDARRLVPTPKTTFSVRLSESVGGEPVMRYYERVGSLARTPLEGLIEATMGRLYAVYEDVLESGPTDVAAPPR